MAYHVVNWAGVPQFAVFVARDREAAYMGWRLGRVKELDDKFVNDLTESLIVWLKDNTGYVYQNYEINDVGDAISKLIRDAIKKAGR